LSTWLVERLIYLRDLPVWAINLIISMLTTTVTEVVSNTATANILLPILKEMSLTLCQNPTYLGKLIFKEKVMRFLCYARHVQEYQNLARRKFEPVWSDSILNRMSAKLALKHIA
jgi:hypothetical protein